MIIIGYRLKLKRTIKDQIESINKTPTDSIRILTSYVPMLSNKKRGNSNSNISSLNLIIESGEF